MAFEEIGISGFWWVLIGILIVWGLIWKGFALWYSARNKHMIWFIFLLISNTVGILPIIYLLTHRKPKKKKHKKK